MVTIREYVEIDGRSPYARWFNRLNAPAAAKVATALVILLGGGTKKRQQKDIMTSKMLWKDYKRRKRQEP